MALFRRFFHRKPPEGLLEISERVYVFDCCLSSKVLEEDEYRFYMGGIVAQLQDYYPDSSFLVFNFREGDKRTQISDILSHYDMTVMEYPRQYEGCPILPLEMVHHFLRSSESWLWLAGQQNVLLMHCEKGGWPVLAFMLAALLLLFRKQYNGEPKILEMVYKQAPRQPLHLLTPINPQPSQLRYLQYISRRDLGSDWPPSDTPLALDCIILRVLPIYGEKGCRPVIRIYGQDSSSTTSYRSPKLLFASSNTNKHGRYYTPKECELLKIDIHQRVQGDVVLECIHLDHVREEMMFRVMFHTAFVRSNIMMLSRDEVDVMWDARDQIPKNFKAEVLFSDVDALPSMITTEGEYEVEDAFLKVQDIFSNVDWLDAKVEPNTLLLKDNGDIVPSTSAAPYSSPPPPLPMYAFPSPPPLPPPPPRRHNTPSPPSSPPPRRHNTPSPPSSPPPRRHDTPSPPSSPPPYGVRSPPPPPPPPPPSAPDLDVSELETPLSAVVPKKDSSKGGGLLTPTGSKTEKVHMVLLPDESQKFWDAFWEKVDVTFMEERLSKMR